MLNISDPYSNIRISICIMFHIYITYIHIFYYYTINVYSHISKISLIYFLIDIYGQNNIYKIHHIGALSSLTIPLFSYNNSPNILCDSWIMTERSSIFLNMNCLYKHDILKVLFIITFFYYRIYNFIIINTSSNIDIYKHNICKDHILYNYYTCISLINIYNCLIFMLNSYWGFKILKKVY